MFIPVISLNGNTLMPTSPARARKLIKKGEATPFFKFGQFCIRLNRPSIENTQSIALGCDPGSKKEAFTVLSNNHTFCNIQSDAVSWVKEKIETRSNLRRARRGRNTPYRQPRFDNRSTSKQKNRLPPSTKARWDLKLGIIKRLQKLYPITNITVEDVASRSFKGYDLRNKGFSPVQNGKKYFYHELNKLNANVKTISGWKTSKLRKKFNLNKLKDKMSEDFHAHAVDSWVMAASSIGRIKSVDNKNVKCISPIAFIRRQLHVQKPSKGGKRKRAGGTRSLGFTKGSIVRLLKPTKSTIKHNKYNLFLVGGNNGKKLTICDIKDLNNRVSRAVDTKNIKFLSYNKFTFR